MIKVVVVRAFQFRGGMVRPGAVLALTEKEHEDKFVASHVEPAKEGAGGTGGAKNDDGPMPSGYCGNGQKPGNKKTGVMSGLEERAGRKGALNI